MSCLQENDSPQFINMKRYKEDDLSTYHNCQQKNGPPQFINMKRYKEDGWSIYHKNESGRSMKIVSCIVVILIALIVFIICYHYMKIYLDNVKK